MGSDEPTKLLYHFESDHVHGFWLSKPEIILIWCPTLMTGRASIVWQGERLESFAGAQRLVDVQADEFVLARSALPLAGALLEQSPWLAGTGVW